MQTGIPSHCRQSSAGIADGHPQGIADVDVDVDVDVGVDVDVDADVDADADAYVHFRNR